MSYTQKNRNIDDLTPQFAQKVKMFFQKCEEAGRQIRLDDGKRTLERQKYLVGQGRSTTELINEFGYTQEEAERYSRPGPKISRTLNSDHIPGIAIDVFFENRLPALYPSTQQARDEVAAIARTVGIDQPYKLNDKMHFIDNGQPIGEVTDNRLFYERIRQDEYEDLPRETFQNPEQVMEKLEGLSNDEKIYELVNLMAILFTKIDQK